MRPRLTPTAADISGAATINAGRFKDRKQSKVRRPLGDPYKGMTGPELDAWYEFRDEMPWLTSAHRKLVRAACKLEAAYSSERGITTAQISTLGVLLSKLGATPVDETRVLHGDEADPDPDDEFFQAAGGRSN